MSPEPRGSAVWRMSQNYLWCFSPAASLMHFSGTAQSCFPIGNFVLRNTKGGRKKKDLVETHVRLSTRLSTQTSVKPLSGSPQTFLKPSSGSAQGSVLTDIETLVRLSTRLCPPQSSLKPLSGSAQGSVPTNLIGNHVKYV